MTAALLAFQAKSKNRKLGDNEAVEALRDDLKKGITANRFSAAANKALEAFEAQEGLPGEEGDLHDGPRRSDRFAQLTQKMQELNLQAHRRQKGKQGGGMPPPAEQQHEQRPQKRTFMLP
mmetsp:Transcript_21203/g.58850  ORF Transcript_21203/g.58850 Transcript_21203/m.58850 type:complete len:120 (+) Transcript_21203:260-619(+)